MVIRRALSFRRQSQDNAQSPSSRNSPAGCHKTQSLQLGDTVLQINGISVAHATHAEATELLRNGCGTVELILSRGGLQIKARLHKESVMSKTGITLSDGDDGAPIICALDSSGAAPLASPCVDQRFKSPETTTDLVGKQMWTDMSRGEQIEVTAIYDNRWNGNGWGACAQS